MKKADTSKTRWHRLLCKMFEELLTPVGIEVYTEFPVMTDPPKADILLLRRETSEWTPKQLERLPDGIKDTRADHVLIEFKYSESVGLPAFRQAVGYDFFYKDSKDLKDRQVQTFLVSAKTTRKETLNRFSYSPTGTSGVYRSKNPLIESVPLLTLNELSKEPHNAYVKCFASRMQEKKAAFRMLKHQEIGSFSMKLLWFLQGLWNHWFSKGGAPMKQELTPEHIIEMGKMWGDAYLSTLSPEERLKGLKPEECLKWFKPEDRLKGLKPEECLKWFKPEDRLKDLSVKEIEAYLRKRKLEKKK